MHVLAEMAWPTLTHVFGCLVGFKKFLSGAPKLLYFALGKQLICLKLESHHSLALTFSLLQSQLYGVPTSAFWGQTRQFWAAIINI